MITELATGVGAAGGIVCVAGAVRAYLQETRRKAARAEPDTPVALAGRRGVPAIAPAPANRALPAGREQALEVAA